MSARTTGACGSGPREAPGNPQVLSMLRLLVDGASDGGAAADAQDFSHVAGPAPDPHSPNQPSPKEHRQSK